MQHSTGSRLVNEAIVVFHTTIRPNRQETRYSSCTQCNILPDSVCRRASCQPPLHLLNPAAAPFLSAISPVTLSCSQISSLLRIICSGSFVPHLVHPATSAIHFPVLKSLVDSNLFVPEHPSHIVHPAVSGHTAQPYEPGCIQRQIQRQFLTLNPGSPSNVRHPSSVSPI